MAAVRGILSNITAKKGSGYFTDIASLYTLFGATFLSGAGLAAAYDHHKRAEEKAPQVSVAEGKAALEGWLHGIGDVSRVCQENGAQSSACREMARRFVEANYAVKEGSILFKPTLANTIRTNGAEAESYFVPGVVPEDKGRGFALRGFEHARAEEVRFVKQGNTVSAMGHYYFSQKKGGPETAANFSFGYKKCDDGTTRAVMHHSSLPFTPEAATGNLSRSG